MRLHCFQIFGEFPTLQPRFKGLTVTPRFLRLPCRRDTCLCALRPHFTPIELRVFPPFQPRFKSPTLPQPSLQPRHAPVGGASPHLPKNCKKKNPPLHPRCEGPTETPRFLSLLHSGDTRVFGRCVLTSTQHLREFPLLQPQFKSPTVSPRFLCLPHSRDTRLWAVRPNFNQKMGEFPPFQQRFKVPTVTPRFLSLPHSGDTRLWAVSLHCFQKIARLPTSATTLQKGPTGTPRFLSFTCSRDTRLWAVRPNFKPKFASVSTSPTTIQRSHRDTWLSLPSPQQRHTRFGRCVPTASKIGETFHISTHDSKVPP